MGESDEPQPAAPRRPWFRRDPIDLGNVLVETVAVVLGILLALAINDWNGRRHDRAAIDSALQSIRAEANLNRQAVSRYRQRLVTMADAMQRDNADTDAMRPCMAWRGWSGVEQPVLLDTAYEVAVVTQSLAKMPFSQASRVGEVYGAQRHMQKMYDQASAMLLADRPVPLSQCVGILREMAQGNSQMAGLYARVTSAQTEP